METFMQESNINEGMANRKQGSAPLLDFSYQPPDEITHPKMVTDLSGSELAHARVQVVTEEGATNRHSHAGNDGFWFVLEGKARFYTGENDESSVELGPREGIIIEHGTPYWFESIDESPLEILHVIAKSESIPDERTDYEEPPEWRKEGNFAWFDTDTSPADSS